MTARFVLEPNELSTPEGLAGACEKARKFVEAHIPGEHKPGPRRYFNWTEDRETLLGCSCALGFLRTAIHGSCQAAFDASWTLSFLEQLSLPFSGLSQFEGGFDASFPTPFEIDAVLDSPWAKAGFELGRKWSRE